MSAAQGGATWVEISPGALTENFRSLGTHVGVPICAVVKANAYGHGLVTTARLFADAGAAMLAVTRIEEARALRAGGIQAPVLLLVPVGDADEAVALNCDQTIDSVAAIAALPSGARVHLKVDTGMGRLGVPASEALGAARAIASRATLAGVWTHFADAAGPSGAVQLARFATVVHALREAGIDTCLHATNSAGSLALPGARYDMVRAGTLLYGQNPVGARAPYPLRDTFTWYARVASVRTLAPGAAVGYGSEWRARKPTRVATIPVGYADGFTVLPSPRTPTMGNSSRAIAKILAALARSPRAERLVYFGDRRAKVVGRVAMQSLTVDVTDLGSVEVGSVARIPARRLLVNPLIDRIARTDEPS